MSRKNQNTLYLGDYNAICDVCGWKFKASDLHPRWDNLMTCSTCWEPRHPQDFIRAIPDMQKVPWTRPEAANTFSSTTFVTISGEENPTSTQVGPDRAPYFDTFAYFDYPVPSLSTTAELSSYNLTATYSCTYPANVFESQLLVNGDIVFTSSGVAAGDTVIDLSAYTDFLTVDIEYKIEDIKGQFHSVISTVDPYFGFVTLLAHMDGSSGSTTFTDNSLYARTLTAAGNTQVNTSVSLFGGGSATFDGSDDLISAAGASEFALAGEFTIEFAAQLSAIPDAAGMFVFGLSVSGGGAYSDYIYFVKDGSNNIKLSMYLGGVTSSTTYTVPLNTMIQFAVSRDASNILRTFVNGTAFNPFSATTVRGGSPFLDIGGDSTVSTTHHMNGYIDEFRFTNGACRYVTDYTPLTFAFPNQ